VEAFPSTLTVQVLSLCTVTVWLVITTEDALALLIEVSVKTASVSVNGLFKASTILTFSIDCFWGVKTSEEPVESELEPEPEPPQAVRITETARMPKPRKTIKIPFIDYR